MPDEIPHADPTPPVRPVEVIQPQSLRSRWEKARPQVVQALRRVADALNRLADEID
jgi:hypothetical protein